MCGTKIEAFSKYRWHRGNMGEMKEVEKKNVMAKNLKAGDWMEQAIKYQNEGQLNDALKCYEGALSKKPRYAIAWRLKGDIHYFKKEFHKAIESYKKVLELDRNFLDTREKLSRICHKMFLEEPKIERKNGYYISSSGLIYDSWVYEELGNLENAIIFLERAIKKSRDSTNILAKKGELLLKIGNYNEAIECFNKVLEVNPQHISVLMNKGAALLGQHDFEESIKYFNEALKINPELKGVWFNKALAYEAQGEIEDAINCLNKALKIDPDYRSAKKSLEELYQKYGNLDEIHQIKKNILDFKEKYSRIHIDEISEKSKINNKEIIVSVIKKMIRRKEIKGIFFESSGFLAFES